MLSVLIAIGIMLCCWWIVMGIVAFLDYQPVGVGTFYHFYKEVRKEMPILGEHGWDTPTYISLRLGTIKFNNVYMILIDPISFTLFILWYFYNRKWDFKYFKKN